MFGAVSLGFAFLAAITAFFYSASPVWLDCKNGVHVPFSPYSPSWNTWFHPSRVVFRGREGVSRDDDARPWNILHHLGGHGPWIEKTDGGVEAHGVDPPEGCSVDQVHMMSRHGERYPTTSAGSRHLEFLSRLKDANVITNGSLSFLNNWTYFTDTPETDFDQLTTTGPYAGTLQAFTTGVRFRTRYGHLLAPQAVRVWASDCNRVVDSARYFAAGLFGLDWETNGKAELEIIPETADRLADTLTPGDTCLRYLDDAAAGHDNGANMLALFQQAYIPPIAERLVSQEGNAALGPLSNVEVFSMQEMCGFEMIARGASPWCDVFTREDWDNYEYARDLIHYYRAGPGTPYAGAMGWLWLNATAELLRKGPDAGTTFFSFVHDGDIAPFLTALDIMKDPKYDPSLPTSHMAADRAWRTSTVMPMGGRIVLERMVCSSGEAARDETPYLRTLINDEVVPLPYCHSGPGMSCSLKEFEEHVDRRRREVGDFADVCGIEGDAGRITFLRQG